MRGAAVSLLVPLLVPGLLSGVLVGLTPAAAAAQEPPQDGAATSDTPRSEPTDDEEAQRLHEAGVIALRRGRFDEALGLFERAYELSEHPELLYNVGLAADDAGRPARAIEAYEAFLALDPDTDMRARVEARLAVLRADEGADQAEPPSPDPIVATSPPPAARMSASGASPVWAWIFGASALGAGLAAGGLGIHVHVRYDELAADCAPGCPDADVDPLRAEALAYQVLGPVAGGLAVAALIALVVELDAGGAPAEDRAQLSAEARDREPRARRRADVGRRSGHASREARR